MQQPALRATPAAAATVTEAGYSRRQGGDGDVAASACRECAGEDAAERPPTLCRKCCAHVGGEGCSLTLLQVLLGEEIRVCRGLVGRTGDLFPVGNFIVADGKLLG